MARHVGGAAAWGERGGVGLPAVTEPESSGLAHGVSQPGVGQRSVAGLAYGVLNGVAYQPDVGGVHDGVDGQSGLEAVSGQTGTIADLLGGEAGEGEVGGELAGSGLRSRELRLMRAMLRVVVVGGSGAGGGGVLTAGGVRDEKGGCGCVMIPDFGEQRWRDVSGARMFPSASRVV